MYRFCNCVLFVVTFYFLIPSVTAAPTGKVDSLQKLIDTSSEKNVKASLLIELSREYKNRSSTDSALNLLHEVLAMDPIDSLVCEGALLKTMIHYSLGQWDSVTHTFDRYRPKAQHSTYWNMRYESLEVFVFHAQGEDNLAIIEFLNRSILICQKHLKQDRYRKDYVMFSTNLAECYRREAKYEEGLKTLADIQLLPAAYWQQSTTMYSRMGAIYQEMGKGRKALQCQKKCLEIAYEKGDTQRIMGGWTDMGYAFLNSETYNKDSALLSFRKALAHNTVFEERPVYATLGLARAYQHHGLYDSAIVAAQSVLPWSRALGFDMYTMDVVDLLYGAYAKVGNMDSAYHYLKLYQGLYETKYHKDRAEEMERMQATHEVAIAQIEQSKAELKSEELRKQQYLLGILVAALVAIVLLAFWAYYRQRKSNTLLTEQHDTIEHQVEALNVLNREIYHRTKNNMQTMSSLLSLQKYGTQDPQARELFEENKNRMHTMSLVHKRLYANNGMDRIALEELIDEQLQDLIFTYGRKDVTIEKELEALALNVDQAIPFALWLNEALSNALKYAFVNHPSPHLKVCLTCKEDKVQVVVEDNGEGLPEDHQEGFGWHLMKSMMRQLKGALSVENKNGLRVQAEFGL